MERSSDLLISDEAVDLLVQLLTEKKNRLCSPKYLLNDFAHSDRLGELLDQSANSHLKSYRGDYVYPDDAAEIKNHPFFKGTRWDELHYRTPPFVPKIRGWEDTKYFDSQQVSDVQDGSSDESSLDEPAQSRGGSEKRAKSDMIRRFTASKSGNAVKNGNLNGNLNLQSKSHKKKREKKRARDKCLRDEQIGKTVLEMRKRNAFVGYTYRRPKDVLLPFEPERGRSITQTER